jgi:F-type H+-transporting ATPase subunit a
MKKVFLILTMMMVALIAPSTAYASSEGEGGELKIKETIFHHLGDGYGWEVPFSHHHRIPLPVIVKDYNGDWHCFSSSRVTNGETYEGFYISH